MSVGMLTCEEYGCNNVDIPLGNLPGAVPGSIGSLHPYKVALFKLGDASETRKLIVIVIRRCTFGHIPLTR